MRRAFAAAISLVSAALFIVAFLSPAEAKAKKHHSRHHHVRVAKPVTVAINDDQWLCIRNPDRACGGGTYFGYAPTPFDGLEQTASLHRDGGYVSPRHKKVKGFVPRVKEAKRSRDVLRHAKSEGAGLGSPNLVAKARQYSGMTAAQIGLHRTTLWCSAFMKYITGASGVDDTARSWLKKPHVSPQVGSIAVLSRGRGGGHVGVVTGFDGSGNPIIVSGNHGRRVGEGVYPRSRVIAFVSAS